MRPLFAITTGITLYCLWGIYWVISEYSFSRPKALLGSVIGALAFGLYSVAEFRRMMRGEDTKYEEERKWTECNIQIGSQIAAAKESLRERFILRQESAGLSPLHGSTMVYDFSSTLSDLRIVAKDGSIISINVEVAREKRG